VVGGHAVAAPAVGRHHAYPTRAYDELLFSMAERNEGGHA